MGKASPLFVVLFVAYVGLVAGLAVAGARAAWLGSGASRAEARRVTLTAGAGVAAWLLVTGGLAAAGALTFDGRPPTMMILLVGATTGTAVLAMSRAGRRLALGLPLAWLVGFQAFRVGVELLLHRAYREGLMPVQMSFEGLNFDIVTGVTAIGVAWLVSRGTAGTRLVAAWNVVGLALLATIVTIAILSAPTPFRAFHNAPANVWVLSAPWVWLPMVHVQLAWFGHLLVFRRLRADASRTRQQVRTSEGGRRGRTPGPPAPTPAGPGPA